LKYKIEHVTRYEYSEEVSLTQNHARLLPVNFARQICHSSRLVISPAPDYSTQIRDRFNNLVTIFEVPTQHTVMEVKAISEVEVLKPATMDFLVQQITWESIREGLRFPPDQEHLDAMPYAIATGLTPFNNDMRQYALVSFTKNRSILDACEELIHRIFTDFTFDPQFSTIDTPLERVFEHRKGVCQDFAHVALACLRSIGLSARYVSGYIETLPPPGQQKLVGADASHAWISVFVPTLGWVDFDPTNDLKPEEQHVVLAVGRDFYDVTPLKGLLFGGGAQTLAVSVDMTRI